MSDVTMSCEDVQQDLLDALADAVTVQGSEIECFENEQIEFFEGHACFLSKSIGV